MKKILLSLLSSTPLVVTPVVVSCGTGVLPSVVDKETSKPKVKAINSGKKASVSLNVSLMFQEDYPKNKINENWFYILCKKSEVSNFKVSASKSELKKIGKSTSSKGVFLSLKVSFEVNTGTYDEDYTFSFGRKMDDDKYIIETVFTARIPGQGIPDGEDN